MHVTTLRRVVRSTLKGVASRVPGPVPRTVVVVTSRGPLTLAALASAAVPGLDPDTVEGVVPTGPADVVEVAFVQDREHRRWVIRCPRTPAASAQLERSAALLAVLARRLTMPVPAVRGWAALPEGGRAAVHSYLTGRLVNLDGIEPGSALAIGLGRALAHLHNLDATVYEEAGVPVYDAASYRSRRLAELDRAAATGRVPTGLLARWERVLDDASLWSFAATPTHGAIGPDTVLATPDDGSAPDIKAFLAWESAQVADPADDLAPLLAVMDADAFETVMEAYAHTRVERPDRWLRQRAEVIGEMQLVRTMMRLVAAGDDTGAEDCARRLRRLDDRLARDLEDAARTHGPAATATAPNISATASAAAPSTATGAGSNTASPDSAAADNAASGSAPSDSAADSSTPDPDTLDTQPVAVRPKGAAVTEEVRLPRQETSGSPAAAGSSGPDHEDDADDDAVQVEHPAKPVPVAPPAHADTASTPDAQDAPPAEDAPADDATTTEDAPADDAATTEDAPPAKPTPAAPPADHETAEIFPINDDDDDDVVPLRPRR